MNAETSPRLPYNGSMFRWAREWRGKTVEDAARRLKTNPANLIAWEDGDGAPTVRQARMLAEFYERNFLEFFLEKPPNLRESELLPDFRLHKGAKKYEASAEIRHIQRWAETQRLNALSLYDLLGEQVPILSEELQATITTNPEIAAAQVRQAAHFSVRQQLELTGSDKDRLPKLIRTAFESLGVLVLRRTDLAEYGVRGICIADFPLPTIVYGNEAPTAQAFTLAHEFGHVLLRQSAISGAPSANDDSTPVRAIELWCDRFAGAFLVPSEAIAVRWAKPNQPMARIGDDTLASLAKAFRVSRHAMLIRLVHLGYVDGEFYWNTKRKEFLQQESDYRNRGGIPAYYGTRYLNAQGDLYTGLVLEAWGRDVITGSVAARFMGIKNLNHLEDIRREYRA